MSTATIALPAQSSRRRSSAAARAESRILLREISWDAYLRLREPDGNNGVRMTYDDEELELTTLPRLHERCSAFWGRAVETWTDERRIPIAACGSMTWKDRKLKKGLEADKCFYIQNELLIREKDEIDLAVDPPPDLAIEVDLTWPLLPKLPIYAAMRAPEVWQYRNANVLVLLLNTAGEYEEATDSRCLPGFPFDEVLKLFETRHTADNNALFSAFRNKIRSMMSREKTKRRRPTS